MEVLISQSIFQQNILCKVLGSKLTHFVDLSIAERGSNYLVFFFYRLVLSGGFQIIKHF